MKLVPKQMKIYTRAGKLASCDPEQIEMLKKAGWSLTKPVAAKPAQKTTVVTAAKPAQKVTAKPAQKVSNSE